MIVERRPHPFLEDITDDYPEDQLVGDWLRHGERVEWTDPVDQSLKGGVAWHRSRQLYVTSMDPNDPGVEMCAWVWNLWGDDRRVYSFEETDLRHPGKAPKKAMVPRGEG